MSSLIEEIYCGFCSQIKPSSEFEQSTKITLRTYRLSWLKEELRGYKELSQGWLDGDLRLETDPEPDEETIASYKNDIRTADDILTIIEDDGLLDRNTTEGLKPHSIQIPINYYQREWLKETFSLHKEFTQKLWRGAKEERRNNALLGISGELDMIEYFLKNLDISFKDVCRDCNEICGV